MCLVASERLSVTKDNCGYFTPGGARVDNCAKAILDDLAVRMRIRYAYYVSLILE